MEIEELYKFWLFILSRDDLQVISTESSNYITLRSGDVSSGFYVKFDEKRGLINSTTIITLEYGIGEAKIVGFIDSKNKLFNEASEALERTKAKAELARREKIKKDRERYISEIKRSIS